MKDMLAWPPAYLVSFLVLVACMLFLTLNLLKYNWKNGEFKTRVALQVWGWAKIFHIWFIIHGHPDWIPPGTLLMISLSAILYIVIRHYVFSKPS